MQRRRRLAAFTLIEILVVITLSVLLLAFIATAIGTLLRAKGRLEDDLYRATQLARLDAQLRSDAHQAVSVEQTDEATVVFHLQPQRIEYVAESSRLIRSIRQDDALLHREVFPLATKTSIQWVISSDDRSPASGPLLSATVTYEPEDSTLGKQIDRLDAAIGLHGRSAE
jgi:type II secretory pathway pseudopilin PulG